MSTEKVWVINPDAPSLYCRADEINYEGIAMVLEKLNLANIDRPDFDIEPLILATMKPITDASGLNSNKGSDTK